MSPTIEQEKHKQILIDILKAITAMVRELRKGGVTKGLVLANGGVLTHQYAVCISSRPREDGILYPGTNPLSTDLYNTTLPPVDAKAEGEAIIEVRHSGLLLCYLI